MNTRGSQLFGVGADVEVRRINMQLVMQLQKRKDNQLTLRALSRNFKDHAGGQGSLDQESFEKAMRKFNLFPAVVEIQALMNHYNCSQDHRVKMIDFEKFVCGLRLPLEGRRLGIVRAAWASVAPDTEAQCITMAQAKAGFKYEDFQMWADGIELENTDD